MRQVTMMESEARLRMTKTARGLSILLGPDRAADVLAGALIGLLGPERAVLARSFLHEVGRPATRLSLGRYPEATGIGVGDRLPAGVLDAERLLKFSHRPGGGKAADEFIAGVLAREPVGFRARADLIGGTDDVNDPLQTKSL